MAVPGSVEEILGQAVPFEGPRLLRGLIDLFHGPDAPARLASDAATRPAAAFLDCLNDLQRLRNHWRAVEQVAGEISLRAADEDEARRALERFLDLLGLRLTRDAGAHRVEAGRDETWRREMEARAAEAADGGAAAPDEAAPNAAAPDATAPAGLPPRTCATGAGGSWRPADVERRLNAGQRIDWDLPHFAVALPLAPRPWLELLDQRTDWDDLDVDDSAAEYAAALVAFLVTEPVPARLYLSLAALDGPTLAWLERDPRLQTRLYAEHLDAFAEFGRTIRVRDGRMLTPGGPEHAPFWEDLVGASVDDPGRFAERLLDQPHLARSFDVLARLQPPRQRFALGGWRKDARARRDGRRDLRTVLQALPAPAPWLLDPDPGRSPAQPSSVWGRQRPRPGVVYGTRQGLRTLASRAAPARGSGPQPARETFGWETPFAVDPAAALRTLAVTDAGAPAQPASHAFWTQVFADDDVLEEPDDDACCPTQAPHIDAAFVLSAGLVGPPGAGRGRLRAIAFAQRVFGPRATDDPAAVFTAARAFARYPMLLLAVERMGVADPRVYAALARAASRLDRIDHPLERPRALSLFQGSLALVEGARRSDALAPDDAAQALLALAETRPAGRDGFGGRIAAWMTGRLLPALGLPVTPSLDGTAMDDALLTALAGAGAGGRLIEWEGLAYRFDPGAARLERLRRARAQLRGNRLDTVLAVARVAQELSATDADASVVAAAAETLQASTALVRNPHIGLPGVDARISSYSNEVQDRIEDLREMARRDRLGRLPRVARELGYVVDVLLADLLRTLAYVAPLADAYEAELLGRDIAARHEFGVHIEDETVRARAAWLPPWGGTEEVYPFRAPVYAPQADGIGGQEEILLSGGWRVYGSLLSLDVAFARMALAGAATSQGPATASGTLAAELQDFLPLGVALFDARRASEGGAAQIAAALRRGRERVRTLAANPAGFEPAADAVGIVGARRNEMRWTLRRRPLELEREFTLGELFRLGGGDERLPGWGAPGLPLDGCLCVRMAPQFGADLARAGAEPLAAAFVDLPLALAEAVDDMGLPGAMVRDLLPFAMRELVERAAALSAGDQADALVRYVRDLPRVRIEDYVAMQVGPGMPLRAPDLGGNDWR